jgi:hypothetical protein
VGRVLVIGAGGECRAYWMALPAALVNASGSATYTTGPMRSVSGRVCDVHIDVAGATLL